MSLRWADPGLAVGRFGLLEQLDLAGRLEAGHGAEVGRRPCLGQAERLGPQVLVAEEGSAQTRGSWSLHSPGRLYEGQSGHAVHAERQIGARTFQGRDAVPVSISQTRPIAAAHSGSPDLAGDGLHVRDERSAVDRSAVVVPARHGRAVWVDTIRSFLFVERLCLDRLPRCSSVSLGRGVWPDQNGSCHFVTHFPSRSLPQGAETNG